MNSKNCRGHRSSENHLRCAPAINRTGATRSTRTIALSPQYTNREGQTTHENHGAFALSPSAGAIFHSRTNGEPPRQ